jgi:hypothetical protein
MPAPEFARRLAARGVKVGAIGGQRIRAVTHYGIEPEDIEYALATAEAVLEA